MPGPKPWTAREFPDCVFLHTEFRNENELRTHGQSLLTWTFGDAVSSPGSGLGRTLSAAAPSKGECPLWAAPCRGFQDWLVFGTKRPSLFPLRAPRTYSSLHNIALIYICIAFTALVQPRTVDYKITWRPSFFQGLSSALGPVNLGQQPGCPSYYWEAPKHTYPAGPSWPGRMVLFRNLVGIL